MLSLHTHTVGVLIQLANLTYNTYAHTLTYAYVCIYVYLYIRIFVYMHIYVFVYVICMCVFVCLSSGSYTHGGIVRSSRGKFHQEPSTVFGASSTTQYLFPFHAGSSNL